MVFIEGMIVGANLTNDSEDTFSFLRVIPLGIGKAVHEGLVWCRVYEILNNETSFLADAEAAILAWGLEFGVDLTQIYMGLGSKPGLSIPQIDIGGTKAALLSALDSLFRLTARNFFILLDRKIPFTNYLGFYDDVSDSIKEGTYFSPDRYWKVRDVYTFIVFKRLLKFLKKLGIQGINALIQLIEILYKKFIAKDRVKLIYEELTASNDSKQIETKIDDIETSVSKVFYPVGDL